MTDWTRRTNFFAVDNGIVDEIGVYDVTKDRVGDFIAASVIGFNGKRASVTVIPELEEYSTAHAVMVYYSDVPLDVIEDFLMRWEVANVPKVRGQKP